MIDEVEKSAILESYDRIFRNMHRITSFPKYIYLAQSRANELAQRNTKVFVWSGRRLPEPEYLCWKMYLPWQLDWSDRFIAYHNHHSFESIRWYQSIQAVSSGYRTICGLLCTELSPAIIVHSDAIFKEFKGKWQNSMCSKWHRCRRYQRILLGCQATANWFFVWLLPIRSFL